MANPNEGSLNAPKPNDDSTYISNNLVEKIVTLLRKM